MEAENSDGGSNDPDEEPAKQDEEEPEESAEEDQEDIEDDSWWNGTDSIEEKIKRIFEGDFNMEIPNQVKLVRIFTSSTFTGMLSYMYKNIYIYIVIKVNGTIQWNLVV